MELGFIGTGMITKAIVTGLCTAETTFGDIWLSPRSAEVAESLSAAFPNVRVAASNQEVLDRAQTVVLAIRPQIAREVLTELHFRPDHHVISLIATFSHRLIQLLITPAHTIVRAVPLPAVARHLGPTVVFPPDGIARRIFTATGTAVEVATETEFDALFAVTAEIASFFALLDSCAVWLVEQGVPDDSARSYLSAMFFALTDTARRSREAFSALITEHSTKGGLNEQLHRELVAAGVFDRHRLALDAILARIRAD